LVSTTAGLARHAAALLRSRLGIMKILVNVKTMSGPEVGK
jgi:hypothetical protein